MQESGGGGGAKPAYFDDFYWQTMQATEIHQAERVMVRRLTSDLSQS